MQRFGKEVSLLMGSAILGMRNTYCGAVDHVGMTGDDCDITRMQPTVLVNGFGRCFGSPVSCS